MTLIAGGARMDAMVRAVLFLIPWLILAGIVAACIGLLIAMWLP